jgi:hypothetical protein
MENRTDNAQDQEFKNFKKLARKLLAVSKKELDQQKAAYQAKKSNSTESAK